MAENTVPNVNHPDWPQQEKVVKEQAKVLESKASSTMSSDRMTPMPTEDWKPGKQEWAIIAGQTCCMFVYSLDATIFSASLPTVATALNAGSVTSYWFITSYLLASAVVQPLTAALSDVFGRRSIFVSSLLLFLVGTIIAGTSNSATQLLAGRTVQGVGGGGVTSVNLIILSDLIPLRHRSKYVGLIQACNAIAIAFGPVIGAALIKVSWRWLFWINLPLLGIGLTISPILLRYVQKQATFYDKVSSIDWIGCGCFLVGATAFLLGLSWGGLQYSWHSAATLVPMVLGLAIVGAVLVYERMAAPRPFLRMSVFGSRSAVASYLCTILVNLTLYVDLYFIVLYLMSVKMYSPMRSSLVFLSMSAVVAPLSGVTGAHITKLAGYRWAIFFGWCLSTFAVGALMVLDANTYLPGLVFVLVVVGIGQGTLFISHQVSCQASAPVKDVAYASAMFSFCRSLGFSLGMALGGTIFANLLQGQLAANNLPAQIGKDAIGYAFQLREMPAGLIRDAVVHAYGIAFKHLFAIMTGISGLGFMLSFLIQEHDLNVLNDSNHQFRYTRTLSPGNELEDPQGRLSEEV